MVGADGGAFAAILGGHHHGAALGAHAQRAGLVRRVLVVDLDVHQGNGTAELCADDESIFTFSMHGARNYPAIKPASDLDVPLATGCGDADYLDALAANLPLALDRARADAVVYLAGADPFGGDRLGLLDLTKAGLAERDRQVLAACRGRRLPVAVAMAGGYAPAVEDIVDIHARTVELSAGFCQAIDQ